MERGILRRLPEILWQHQIVPISMLVEFTQNGCFDSICKSSPRVIWALSFFYIFSASFFFPVKMQQIQKQKKGRLPAVA